MTKTSNEFPGEFSLVITVMTSKIVKKRVYFIMLHDQIITSCGTLLKVSGHRLRRSAADGGVEELRQYLEEEITCPDDPQDPNPTQSPTALPIDGRYARKIT